MKHIKIVALTLASVLIGVVMLFPVMADAMASPVMADLKSDAGAGANQVGGGGIKIESVFSIIVNILSLIVGVVAIIVIIASGLKYITSGGDSNKVSSAKNTLIYALIGVAVAALAQILVRFVLFQTSQT